MRLLHEVCMCVCVCTVRFQRTKLCSEVPVFSMSVHTSFVIRKSVCGNKMLTFRLFITFLSHLVLDYHISILCTTSIFIKQDRTHYIHYTLLRS
jgi:hypothetical protein